MNNTGAAKKVSPNVELAKLLPVLNYRVLYIYISGINFEHVEGHTMYNIDGNELGCEW